MRVEGLPKPPLGDKELPEVITPTWTSSHTLDQSGRPWLAAMTQILMRAHEPGTFADKQDTVAVSNSRQLQAIIAEWYPWMQEIDIIAETDVAPPHATGKGVGCFFSGGVDSFYSLVTRLEEVTHLIFVRQGFDIHASEAELSEEALREMQAAADAYGKELIVVSTDIRRYSDRFQGWGERYHGAALATVGLLLSEHLSRVIIPSSFSTEDLHPWGSHPDTDPLWSTSEVAVEHHGEDTLRYSKVAAISSDDVAMRHLRICWRNTGGAYNCGTCEKCLRTMTELYMVKALDRCETLPKKIDTKLVRGLKLHGSGQTFARTNIDRLRSVRGRFDPVYRAWKHAYEESQKKKQSSERQ